MFAASDLLAMGAIRALEEFLNDIAFYGDPNRQIYGALTYPDLAKMVISTRFNVPTNTGTAIALALNNLVQTIEYVTVVGGELLPDDELTVLTDAVASCGRLMTYLAQEATTP